MTPPVPETHTPPRQIRIGDRWYDFEKAAKLVDMSRAEVANALIAWWLREPGAKYPRRPERSEWAEPD